MPGSRLKRHAGSPAPKCVASHRRVVTSLPRPADPDHEDLEIGVPEQGFHAIRDALAGLEVYATSTDAVFRSAKRLSQRATRPGFGTRPARLDDSRAVGRRRVDLSPRSATPSPDRRSSRTPPTAFPTSARRSPPVQGEAHPREGSDGLRRRPPAARARWAAVARRLRSSSHIRLTRGSRRREG